MKKLQQISALSGAFLVAHGISAQIADPTINYVNLDPDSVLLNTETGYPETTGSMVFDVNDDGIDDLKLKFTRIKSWTTYFDHDYVSHLVEFYGINQAAVLCDDNFGLAFVYALDSSEMISNAADGSWLQGGFKMLAIKTLYYPVGGSTLLSSFDLGYWAGVTGKYAGVKLKIGTERYYGWVRLSISEDMTHISINDYAFRNVPFTGIITGATGLECNAPFQLDPVLLSPTQVRLKWQAPADAVSYKLYYRAVGAPSWTIKNIAAPKTSKIINGLVCNTNYEWKMRATCDGGATFSSFSDTKTFITTDCRVSEEMENSNGIPIAIGIYPNPASEFIYVVMENADAVTALHILDMNGQLVLEQLISGSAEFQIDVSGLSNGIYILNLISDLNSTSQQIIINK